MTEKLKILLFILLVTAFFGTAVSGLNAGLRDRIELNEQVREQRVILGLLGRMPAKDAEPEAIARTYEEKVEAITLGSGPDAYTYYRLKSDPDGTCVFKMAGMGFWDLIEGFFAYDQSTATIKGVAFTNQKETPGLGARIEEKEWRMQFEGMVCGKPDEQGRYIRVVPPGSKNPERAEVDAVTGATGTSQAMEKIINASIREFLLKVNQP